VTGASGAGAPACGIVGDMDVPRTMIVDPFLNDELLELAELSGVPFTRVRSWGFDPSPPERIVTTVPLPRGVGGDVRGGALDVDVPRGVGERWPERVVSLPRGRADVLAWLGGAERPGGRVVGVIGLAGGLGTTTLAAALARALAGTPLAVAQVDPDPVSTLEERIGLVGVPGPRWADLAVEDGPLLPHRIDAVLPVWRRVRVVTSDERGMSGAAHLPGVHALARTHDVTVVDLPRAVLTGDAALAGRCGDVVVLMAGLAAERAAWERLRALLPAAVLPPVVRTGGEVSPGERARELGAPVVALGAERPGGTVVQPGDRRRGAVMTAARALAAAVVA